MSGEDVKTKQTKLIRTFNRHWTCSSLQHNDFVHKYEGQIRMNDGNGNGNIYIIIMSCHIVIVCICLVSFIVNVMSQSFVIGVSFLKANLV